MTQNLNEAYDEYQRTKDLEALYPYVKQRAAQAVVSVLHRAAPEDLVITCTTNVLMGIDKFQPGRSAFSSWVFLSAKSDCVNELRRGEPPYIDPIVGEDGQPHFQNWAFDHELYPKVDASEASKWSGRFNQRRSKDVLEQAGDIENDDFLMELYTRIETVLDPEEKELVRLKFEGHDSAEIAEILEMPRGTVDRKYHEVKDKLRSAA